MYEDTSPLKYIRIRRTIDWFAKFPRREGTPLAWCIRCTRQVTRGEPVCVRRVDCERSRPVPNTDPRVYESRAGPGPRPQGKSRGMMGIVSKP